MTGRGMTAVLEPAAATDRFRVLLVEDDPAHAMVIRRAFEEHGRAIGETVELSHCDEAEAACAHLLASPRPDLVVLDLKLRGTPGLDVLRRIKGDPRLRRVPVVVLSTSSSERDRVMAFRHHACGYIEKPERLDGFRAMAGMLLGFWSRRRGGR